MVQGLYCPLVDSSLYDVTNVVLNWIVVSPVHHTTYVSFTLTAGLTNIKSLRPSVKSATDNTSNSLKQDCLRYTKVFLQRLFPYDSVILWIVKYNSHIIEHFFIFQNVMVDFINISSFQLRWCAYKHISNPTVVIHLRCDGTYNAN